MGDQVFNLTEPP